MTSAVTAREIPGWSQEVPRVERRSRLLQVMVEPTLAEALEALRAKCGPDERGRSTSEFVRGLVIAAVLANQAAPAAAPPARKRR